MYKKDEEKYCTRAQYKYLFELKLIPMPITIRRDARKARFERIKKNIARQLKQNMLIVQDHCTKSAPSELGQCLVLQNFTTNKFFFFLKRNKLAV